MAASLESIVQTTLDGLGYELVEVERAPRGLVRVFADRMGLQAGSFSVEDCARISNQLTRVFAVELIDYERLEVSSPGLDRPLKSLADFQRYVGRAARLRLFAAVDARKRFEGRIDGVSGDSISFSLTPDEPESPKKGRPSAKTPAVPAATIVVAFENIERARLVPEI